MELLLAEVGHNPGPDDVTENVEGRPEPVEQPVNRKDDPNLAIKYQLAGIRTSDSLSPDLSGLLSSLTISGLM